MGIYTNHSNIYVPSSDYRDVEPYHGDHFNYHELGIIAATESAVNQNTFMKAIALGELASVEQYGSEQVFYETVNIKGIFERIKAFFKKIIEKIHKIFHTFIAKMSSWFGNSRGFAKKYEKEIIKNWGLIKNDWEFKGYKFTSLISTLTKESAKNTQTAITASKNDDPIVKLLKNSDNAQSFANALADMVGLKDIKGGSAGTIVKLSDIDASFTKGAIEVFESKDDGTKAAVRFGKVAIDLINNSSISVSIEKGKYYDFSELFTNGNIKEVDASDYILSNPDYKKAEQLAVKFGMNNNNGKLDTAIFTKFREDFNEKGKDQIRHSTVESFKQGSFIVNTIDIEFNHSGAYDDKEFTEELHKAIYGEDDNKEDLNKSEIEKAYGSISSMLTFLKDYDKIKSSIEKSEKDLVASIDKKIDAIDKAQNVLIKDKDKANANINQSCVQVSSIFQSFWGFIKECEIQVFSTYLQGLKDACSQAKQICVKVIGLGKDMTEESYDYRSSSAFNNPVTSFMESVKLV